MNSRDGQTSMKIKKSYHSEESKKPLYNNIINIDKERRERASSKIYQSAKKHSFSPVYSKQYSNKFKGNQENKLNDTLMNENKENEMEEIYQIIEDKIRASGYTREISGFTIYSEISDFIEEKENGSYIFLSKNQEDVVMEYRVDVMSDNFNLSYIDITALEDHYHINFDE